MKQLEIVLEEIAHIRTGMVVRPNGTGDVTRVHCLRAGNLRHGEVDLSGVDDVGVPAEFIDRYGLQQGDILLPAVGSWSSLGQPVGWTGQFEPCLHQNHVIVVRPDARSIDPCFLKYHLASSRWRRHWRGRAIGSRRFARIATDCVRQFPVWIPSRKVQSRIVEILRTWERAIELLKRRIVLCDRFWVSCWQRDSVGLLGGNRKEPGTVPLEKITEEMRVRNNGRLRKTEVCSLDSRTGLTRRSLDTSAGLDRFKVVEPGWLVFNSARIRTGAVTVWKDQGSILVNPRYKVVRCQELKLLPEYLEQQLRAPSWFRFMRSLQGKGHISYQDLARYCLPCPSLDTQRLVANLLSSIDLERRYLVSLSVLFSRQLQGLIQRIFDRTDGIVVRVGGKNPDGR